MIIKETKLPGVFTLKTEPFSDERGSFSRLFCEKELEEAKLRGKNRQSNLCYNPNKGTLRGLHSQTGPDAEDKIVYCVSGEIYDVCVDLRESSVTKGKWHGEYLSAENGMALYIPKGFAHGYLTMADNTSVLYFATQFYKPGAEQGYRFDDPYFGIEWPLKGPYLISEKDRNWPLIIRAR